MSVGFPKVKLKHNYIFMKKLLIILSFFIFLFLTIGCGNIGIKHMESIYLSKKNQFNQELVSHFPYKLPKGYLGGYSDSRTILADSCFGPMDFIMYANYDSIEYNYLKAQIDSLMSEYLRPPDANLLLIFSYCDKLIVNGKLYQNQETQNKKKLANRNLLITNGIPVPLFLIDEYYGNTICGLSKDFNLYVFDAKPGKYLEDKYLQDCECLPKEWKHGYSKGVALSDTRHVIVYWTVVW